jgi:hypothetical protein
MAFKIKKDPFDPSPDAIDRSRALAFRTGQIQEFQTKLDVCAELADE